MTKLNKQKMESDMQRLIARLAYIAGILLFFIVAALLGAGFYFSAKYLIDLGYYIPIFTRTGPYHDLINCLPFGAAMLTILASHYARFHGGGHLMEILERVAKTNNIEDRRYVRRYCLRVLFQGTIVIGAGDVACILGRKFFEPTALVGSIAWALGAGLAALCFYLMSWFRGSKQAEDAPSSPLIRGTLVNTFAQAKMNALSLLNKLKNSLMHEKQYLIRWAGVDLPGTIESHFGIVGISGSGKTLALQTLMRSVIPTIRDIEPNATAQRALVFDPENKFIPFLQELAGEENVQILNPFDRRSRPWDLANDVEDLASAQEMASIFVEQHEGESAQFWQRASRGILSAVIKALHLKAAKTGPKKWTLRHVFHIVTNEARLTAVLRATDQTQALIELLRPTKDTLFNVLADLRSHMDMLELVAALWDNSVKVLGKKPFTLKEWLEGRDVLVFGRPTQLEDTILALNRVLVKRASQLIRSPMPKKEADARGRTWIFLDELRNIGNLPGLDKLLTEGRSRGARVAITFQDIDGLREVYTERIAEEIANQCDQMSYLRCRGTTAKWAAERIGRCEFWDKDFSSGTSQTSGQSPSSTFSSGSNTRKNLTDAVLESQLSGLPTVEAAKIDGKAGGYVQGWHEVTAVKCIYPTKEKDAWYSFEETDKGDRFVGRLPEDQILRPWDEKMDWDELGFNPMTPNDPSPPLNLDDLRG